MNKKTTILGLLAAILLMLNGCGGDSSAPSATSVTTASGATAGAPAGNVMEQIPSPFTPAPQIEPTYIGDVDDSDAYVAVAMSGNEAVAFVCDGDDRWMWLTGHREGDQLTMSGPGDATLTASMAGGAMTGQVTGAGLSDAEFDAAPAGQDEGLYRATTDHEGATYTLGWIMRADGVRGMERRADGTSINAIAVDRGDDDKIDMDDRQRRRLQDRREDDSVACAEMKAYNDWLASQPQTPAVTEMMSMNTTRMGGC
ncbi:MAG: hypothetical protein WAW17_09265 [Rhodococcus sp. (in: high G+C Gram-positive bacteria)]|uniref:hypothetical protein n=1 Tax=Rhodococcus sp. TaxID=1831 RepID=UPI003BAEDEAE